MLDRINLHEVIAVERVIFPSNLSTVTGLAVLETAVDFSRSFQIRTISDGANSGRKYFLQAENDTQCSDLVMALQSLVRSAVSRSKSPGQRRQEFLREVYNSNIFQSIAAFLIIMVRITTVYPFNQLIIIVNTKAFILVRTITHLAWTELLRVDH